MTGTGAAKRFDTLHSTASAGVIDLERSMLVDVFHAKCLPGTDDCDNAARARADHLNAHPQELHVDRLRTDPLGPVLLERVVVAFCGHTMAECEYGIPQA